MAKKRKKKARKFDDKPRLMKGGVQVMGALEKIQKLQEQIQEATTAALEELRTKRKEAADALADIDRQITELGGKAGKTKGTRKSSAEAVCKICEIPGHDARAHRAQGKNKKPFTKEELREKGFAA